MPAILNSMKPRDDEDYKDKRDQDCVDAVVLYLKTIEENPTDEKVDKAVEASCFYLYDLAYIRGQNEKPILATEKNEEGANPAIMQILTNPEEWELVEKMFGKRAVEVMKGTPENGCVLTLQRIQTVKL